MIFATVLVYFTLRLPPMEKEHLATAKNIDFPGAVSLFIAVATPLFALNLGGSILPWGHPIVIAMFCLVPFGFGLFYFVESRMATLPIIPMHLLRMPAAVAVMSCAFPIVFAFNQVFIPYNSTVTRILMHA